MVAPGNEPLSPSPPLSLSLCLSLTAMYSPRTRKHIYTWRAINISPVDRAQDVLLIGHCFSVCAAIRCADTIFMVYVITIVSRRVCAPHTYHWTCTLYCGCVFVFSHAWVVYYRAGNDMRLCLVCGTGHLDPVSCTKHQWCMETKVFFQVVRLP